MHYKCWIILCLCGIFCGIATTAIAQSMPPAASPTRAHETLQRVLSRPEFITYNSNKYARKTPSRLGRWFQHVGKQLNAGLKRIGESISRAFRPVNRFFERLSQRLARMMPKSANSDGKGFTGLGRQIKMILYTILACALLFLIGLIVSRLLSVHRSKPLTENLEAVAADPVIRRKQEPTFWERSLQEAEELWAQGHQREAFRVLQRACLVLLDARGILRYDDTRANGEVLRALRRMGRTGTVQSLRPVVRSFDRSWYGLLQLHEDEFRRALESSRLFRENVLGEA